MMFDRKFIVIAVLVVLTIICSVFFFGVEIGKSKVDTVQEKLLRFNISNDYEFELNEQSIRYYYSTERFLFKNAGFEYYSHSFNPDFLSSNLAVAGTPQFYHLNKKTEYKNKNGLDFIVEEYKVCNDGYACKDTREAVAFCLVDRSQNLVHVFIGSKDGVDTIRSVIDSIKTIDNSN